jgi:MFS transporter, FHS family, glucose/mannose:H+ symporter
VSLRRAVFVCACLGLLTFGIVLTTLGAVLPSVIVRFGIDKATAGTLFLVMTLGMVAGSLVFGPVVDSYGYKGMLLTATALIIVGLEGIAFAPSMSWLRSAVILIGFAGGIVNGGANAVVADISAEGRGAGLSLLHVFFGVGAMSVPLALGLLPERVSYSMLMAGVGTFVLIPIAAIALTSFPAPKQPQVFPVDAVEKLLGDPWMLLMGLMLFLESGMEITVGGWTSIFFKEALAVPDRKALLFLSLYWMGMMLARLALGALLRRVPPVRLLYACMTTALVGAVLLLTTRSVAVAVTGVFLLGVGFAPTFPLILSFIGDRYAAISGTAFGVAITMALAGGTVLPYAAGVLGASYGMRGSFVIVPAALLVLMALLRILSNRLRSAAT